MVAQIPDHGLTVDALERLYRAHWPRAYRAAYLVVHDSAGAEDIAQEAFLAAVRALEQWQGMPVYVVDSTFGGAPGQGGVCSNGGALSSIGVSWSVLNCVMTYNSAIGHGANPARSGTPGGGSGGAIYTDGNTYTVTIQGSIIEHNTANEGGGALFYVSNDRTGTLSIRDSTLSANPSKGFWTDGYPGIFFLGSAKPSVSGSTLN